MEYRNSEAATVESDDFGSQLEQMVNEYELLSKQIIDLTEARRRLHNSIDLRIESNRLKMEKINEKFFEFQNPAEVAVKADGRY